MSEIRSAKSAYDAAINKNIIDSTEEHKLAVCIVIGLMHYGIENKNKVKNWINKTTDLLDDKTGQENFEKYCNNFKTNRLDEVKVEMGDTATAQLFLFVRIVMEDDSWPKGCKPWQPKCEHCGSALIQEENDLWHIYCPICNKSDGMLKQVFDKKNNKTP